MAEMDLGINVRNNIDLAKSRERSYIRGEQPIDPFDLYEGAQRTSMLANEAPTTAAMMPEIVAQRAMENGMSMEAAMAEFGKVEAELTVESWRDYMDFIKESNDDKTTWQYWQNLDPAIKKSLEAAGYDAPRPPGKSWHDHIPGLNSVGGAIGAVAGPVFKGMDWVEQTFVSRPMQVQSMGFEDMMGGSIDDKIGWMPDAIQGAIGPGIQMFLAPMGGWSALWEGRLGEYWAMSDRNNLNVRGDTMDAARKLLDGDEALIDAASALVLSDGDYTEAVEMLTGEDPGTETFNEVMKEMVTALSSEDGETPSPLAKAVEMMSNDQIGLGSLWAESQGMKQGDPGFGLQSGLWELGILMVFDPTIVAAKANTMRKVVQHGVQGGYLLDKIVRTRKVVQMADKIDAVADAGRKAKLTSELFETSPDIMTAIKNADWRRVVLRPQKQIDDARGVQRVVERIARVADPKDEYSLLQLSRDVPRTRYMRQALGDAINQGHITKNPESVWDWMEGATGLRAMNSGFIGRNPRLIQIPRISNRKDKLLRGNSWWTRTMDISGNLPEDLKAGYAKVSAQLDEDAIEIGEATQAFRKLNVERRALEKAPHRWAVNHLKGFAHRATQHVPRNPYVHTSTYGKRANEGINEFERLLEMGNIVGMDDITKGKYLDRFAFGTEAERVLMIRQFTTEMLARGGVLDESEHAQDILQRFGIVIDQNFAGMDEGVGLLEARMGDLTRHSSLWDSQLASSTAIGNFRQLQKATRKEGFFRMFAGRSYDRVDYALGRYWKPSVLMRLGFIPRAAGEETASFALRLGMLSYAKAQFGRRWVLGQVFDPLTQQWVTTREVAPTIRWMRGIARKTQMWSHTTAPELNEIAMEAISKSDRGKVLALQNMLDEAKFAGGEVHEIAELEGEIRKVFDPKIKEYLDQMPATSRAMMNLGRMAESFSVNYTNAWNTISKGAHLPSRVDISRKLFGTSYEGMAGKIPVYNRKYGMFTIDGDLTARAAIDGVSMDDLVFAQAMANANPAVMRAYMDGLGAAYADYGRLAQPGDRMATGRNMSRDTVLREKITRTGKTTYVPMRPTQKWDAIDQIDNDFREAFGNALMYQMTDSTMRNSGAMARLSSFAGADVRRVLDDDQLAGLTEVRNHLAEFLDRNPETARAIKFHYAKGESPREAFQAAQAFKGKSKLDFNELERYLDALEPLGHRGMALLYPDSTTLRSTIYTDVDEMMRDISDDVRRMMNNADYQPDLRSLVRVARDQKSQIARPLQEKRIRSYAVTLDMNVLEDVLQAYSINGTGKIGEELIQMGVPAPIAERIGRMSMDDFAEWAQAARLNRPELVRDVSFLPISFADPDVASDVATGLDRFIAKYAPEADVHGPFKMRTRIDMVDLPDQTAVGAAEGLRWNPDMYNAGDYLELDGVMREGLYAPQRLDQGSFTKFYQHNNGEWHDSKYLPHLRMGGGKGDYTGRTMLVNGESEHALRIQLGNERVQEIRKLMVQNDEPLSELAVHMQGGTFEPSYHPFQVDEKNLPMEIFAPVMVDQKSLAWDRLVQGWFQGVVDPAMAGIIRTPHFMHNFAASLPIAADYYRATTQSAFDVDMVNKLRAWGAGDDFLDNLLGHIHMVWGDPDLADDHSAMARLIEALHNPSIEPEVGAKYLMAAAGGEIDKKYRAYDEIYQHLVDDFVDRYGRLPSNVEDNQIEDLVEVITERRIRNRPDDENTIAGLVDDLQDLDPELDGYLIDEIQDEILRVEKRLENNSGEFIPTLDDLISEAVAESGREFQVEQIVAQWDNLRKWAANRHYRFAESIEQASIRAVDMTIEFIDDHRFRSQFQQTVRNFMPFWFAEEQFLKRQARMIMDSPESIRRASLIMNFGRESGMIQQDTDGNEIFVYPGSEAINSVLYEASSWITGMDMLDVYVQPMSTRVEYMLPGYSGEYVEGGMGPFVGFSTAMLSSVWPELAWIDESSLIHPNEISRGRNPLEHLIPRPVLNAAAAAGWEFGPDRILQAQNQAIQMAAAEGQMPGPDASATEIQDFLDKTRHHARIIAIMNAAMYSLAPLPAGGRIAFNDLELDDDFQEIVFNSGLPHGEAMSLFFKMHPDATPWTVFKSSTTTGVPVAAIPETSRLLNEYEDEVRDNPLAFAWLLPRSGTVEGEGEFSRRAQADMFAAGLKTLDPPKEYMEEIWYSEQSRIYYNEVNQLDLEIWEARKAGNLQLAHELEAEKEVFDEMFNNTHPVFKDVQTSRSNGDRREKAKAQRDAIVAMPRDELPPGPYVDQMLAVMSAHSEFNNQYTAMTGMQGTEVEIRRGALRREFIQWLGAFQEENPATAYYISSQIRWDPNLRDAGPEAWFEAGFNLGDN